MTSFDPFFVEQKFNETLRMIQSSPSERIQITSIEHFIYEVWEYRLQVSSYLEQLLPYLPDLNNPLLLAGIHPKRFSELIQHFEIIADELNDSNVNQTLRNYQQCLLLLKSWMGVNDSINGGMLESYHGKENPEYKPGEVLIPVVEDFKGTNQHSGIGRLRKLRIDIIGENKKGKTELTPAFAVIGKDAGSFLEGVVQSAKKLLSASKKGKHRNWKATAHLSMSHAWHTGRSANLALAAALYCEMLKAEEMAEFFRMNPSICISGDVDDFGNVLPVEGESLELKTEAAFFSWVQILVVPVSQLQEVQQIVETLKKDYPNRDLALFGVSKIEELFYDRRLTIHEKTDVIIHNFRKIWKRKFNVASILTLILLVGIIARLGYGPVDRNPTIYEYEGTEIVLKNKSGFELNRIQSDEYNISNATKEGSSIRYDVVKLFDQDGDGLNEVLLNLTKSQESQDGILLLLSSDLKDTLWVNDLNFPIGYKKHPYAYTHQHRGRRIEIEDLDGDGEVEIILTSEQVSFFQGHLNIISSSDGTLKQSYKGTGWFSTIEIADFDGDNRMDILTCGEFKGFSMIGCSLLDNQNIEGFTPLSERYWDNEKPRAIEKAVFLWPRTIVGRTYDDIYKNNSINSVYYSSLNLETRTITLMYLDTYIKTELSFRSINIIMTFDFNMNLISVASSDLYDELAQDLYDDGLTRFLADAIYLDTFKDSLYYWNGTEFQRTPTLNKKYLEVVGEDSSFYKDFYFSKTQ